MSDDKDIRIGIYPGTFDPVTNGHIDVINRASKLVDRLVVGVARNIGKSPFFDLEERVEMVTEEIARIKDQGDERHGEIQVVSFEGLLMHFAEAHDAGVIVRGLRAVSDFEYEFQMVGMNRRLNKEVETVFLMASESNQFIASRLVKEIAVLGGEIKEFVPPRVTERIAARLQKKK
ncbi:MAG: pantetheine-phosphate adenylyltransferase [Rhodospirillaceae bacterium]|nr:pantetheine-phosphate adenylyltransferase [Rhodospirillaceae bacterium]